MSPHFPFRQLCSCLLFAGLITPATPALASAAQDLSANPLPLLLAQNYQRKFDPAAFLVSEKLDGVRAFWDGKQLRFRSGKLIHAPAWFLAALPAQALDGELSLGRGKFDQLSAAVRRQEPRDEEWRQISYQLYELPGADGSFVQRVQQLQQLVAQAGQAWLQVVMQERVPNYAALQAKLKQVVAAGGEGLMLHKADAAWQTGRSDVLLKFKPQLDAEAVVIAHEAGQGKYQGMLGALVLQTADGQQFRLGSGFSDEQRRAPPEIGSVVTYRYRALTANGLPRFASFVRLRETP